MRRAAVEQFLGRYEDEGRLRVAWIEIRPGSNRYEVRRFDVEDPGGSGSADLYEWVDMNAEQESFVFDMPEQAIEFAAARWGAFTGKWVNQGVVQDEYLDALGTDSNPSN